MLDNVLFSIVMPAFNSLDYIEAAIQSVENQTYKDWELIIVDDGSTDGTIEECEKYVCDNIKLLCYQHQGPLLARESGALCSKGKYLLFLDSDDVLHPMALEILSKYLDNLSFFKNIELPTMEIDSIEPIDISHIISYDCQLTDYDYSQNYINCTCVKKELFLETSKSIPADLKQYRFCEDLLICTIMVLVNKGAHLIDCPLYYKRYNKNSITHTLTYDDKMGRFYIVDYLYRYISENDDITRKGMVFNSNHIYAPFCFFIGKYHEYIKKKKDFDVIRNSFSFKLEAKHNVRKFNKLLHLLVKLRLFRAVYCYLFLSKRMGIF